MPICVGGLKYWLGSTKGLMRTPLSVPTAPFRASMPYVVVAPGAAVPTSTFETTAPSAPSRVTPAVVSAANRVTTKPSSTVGFVSEGPKYTPLPFVGARTVLPVPQRDQLVDS